jgi:hypothetical protein
VNGRRVYPNEAGELKLAPGDYGVDPRDGHWYARAMSSYALLGAYSGARYDAVDRILHLRPPVKGDFKAFICTATGYGHVGVKDDKPFCDVVSGEIPFKKMAYTAP